MEQPEDVIIVHIYKRKAKKASLGQEEVAYIMTFKKPNH